MRTEKYHEAGQGPGPGAQSKLYHDGVGQGRQQGSSKGGHQPKATFGIRSSHDGVGQGREQGSSKGWHQPKATVNIRHSHDGVGQGREQGSSQGGHQPKGTVNIRHSYDGVGLGGVNKDPAKAGTSLKQQSILDTLMIE